MYGGTSDTISMLYDREEIEQAWEMPVEVLKSETLKIRESIKGKEVVLSSQASLNTHIENKMQTPSKRLKEDYVQEYLEVLYEVRSIKVIYKSILETLARDGQAICFKQTNQAAFSD